MLKLLILTTLLLAITPSFSNPPICKNFHSPKLILESKQPLTSPHWAIANRSKPSLFAYCRNTEHSCCTPGDVRRIGDNFNNPKSNFSSKASLLKNFNKWWGTVDSIFERSSDLIQAAQKILKDPKSYAAAKISATSMIEIL